MKANELRIGNYIQEGKIWYLEVDENGTYFYKADSMGTDANPIPLTEEWIFKFGFKKTLSNYFWININDVRVEVKEVKDGFVLLDDGGTWISFVFKYVHQLQKLYFALTGQEL